MVWINSRRHWQSTMYVLSQGGHALFPLGPPEPKFEDWQKRWLQSVQILYMVKEMYYTANVYRDLQGLCGGVSTISAGKNPVIFTDFPCNPPAICKYYRVFPADIAENPPKSPCKSLWTFALYSDCASKMFGPIVKCVFAEYVYWIVNYILLWESW